MLDTGYFINDCHSVTVLSLTNVGSAMHFIYYINRLTARKVDSTYLGCLTSNTQRIIMSVAGLERMTTVSAVSALSYRATQVDEATELQNLQFYMTIQIRLIYERSRK